MAVLEEKIDNENRAGKVIKEFVVKSYFPAVIAFFHTRAHIPVGNSVFEIVSQDDKGNTDQGIGYFGGDEGSCGSMGY